ncbi:P-loop NTPase family protein [Aeromonas caviae]|uniref:hypothetical protein n=1 Tax=Aeromonas caviae TaxID=648 RepID=UPI0011AEB124|nr:hypothetical protein [Aeromonas caviae]
MKLLMWLLRKVVLRLLVLWGVPVSDAHSSGAAPDRGADPFLMPFRVTELFVTGSSGAIYAGRFEGLVIFSGVRGNQELAFNSDDLVNMGYKVDYLGDCYSVVTDRAGRAITVNCAPRIYSAPTSPDKAVIPENVVQLASLTNLSS